MTKENSIIERCKEKLRTIGHTALLIPESIEELARRYPHIICNDLTEEMATAIVSGDILLINGLAELGGLINNILHCFVGEIPKGETVMVHHHKNNYYLTSIVIFKYHWDGTIVCENDETIECNNIIAITKVPAMKEMMKRSIRDDQHKVFTILVKKMCA